MTFKFTQGNRLYHRLVSLLQCRRGMKAGWQEPPLTYERQQLHHLVTLVVALVANAFTCHVPWDAGNSPCISTLSRAGTSPHKWASHGGSGSPSTTWLLGLSAFPTTSAISARLTRVHDTHADTHTNTDHATCLQAMWPMTSWQITNAESIHTCHWNTHIFFFSSVPLLECSHIDDTLLERVVTGFCSVGPNDGWLYINNPPQPDGMWAASTSSPIKWWSPWHINDSVVILHGNARDIWPKKLSWLPWRNRMATACLLDR